MLQKTQGALSEKKHQSRLDKSRDTVCTKHKTQDKDKQNKKKFFHITNVIYTNFIQK